MIYKRPGMIHSTRHRIAVYADRDSKASPSPIDQEMRRVFRAEDFVIEHVTRHDLLRPSLYRDLAFFVLPGISGEDSLYHLHVGPANDMIRDYVAGGGGLFTQCAGSNYTGDVTIFTPEWAQARRRDSGLLGIFNGIAHGPPPGLGVDGNDPRYHRGLTSTRITIQAGDMTRDIAVAYSSGPAFFAAANSTQNIAVHARYTDAPGRTPAIISFPYGKGFALLSGPVPHQGFSAVADTPDYAALNALMKKLQPFEADRAVFFDGLMRLLYTHVQKAGLPPALSPI